MKPSELFSSLLTFIADKSKSSLSKGFLIFSIVLFFMCVDNLLGFLFYYNTDKKITQVNKINEILHDTSLTKQERQNINDMRLAIITHKNIKDKIYSYISSVRIKNNDKSANKNYYGFWFFLSAFFVWLILIISLPISYMTGGTTISLKFLFPFEILFIAVGYAEYQLLTLIPIIFGNPVYNYIFNIIFNIVGSFIVAYSINKHNKG